VRAVRLRALSAAPDAFGASLAEELRLAPATWKARLGQENAATFLARHRGRDVGLAVVVDEGEGAAGLYAVWVEPTARRAGLGGRLVDAALGWARARGLRHANLEVGERNASAIALYARCGFRPTGRRRSLPPPRAHVTEQEWGRSL
jgi:ribosomal protein S18 acetylase RimI-like enzyme